MFLSDNVLPTHVAYLLEPLLTFHFFICFTVFSAVPGKRSDLLYLNPQYPSSVSRPQTQVIF